MQRDRVRPSTTATRKGDHVRISVEEDVEGKGVANGFEAYRLVHCALPEFDFDRIETSASFFGRRLNAPLLISCMTGGTPQAREINRTLATVAQEHRLAMGLGSARVLLEDAQLADTFAVRDIAPDVLLFANLGAVQLNRGYDADSCRRVVEMLGADALALHLNALQEALQPEGDTCFGGLLKRIETLCKSLDVPVIVKEVGWGIDPQIARALVESGVAGIDVAGAGGTSWSEVERHRNSTPWGAAAAAAFSGWGIPTAEALCAVQRVRGSAVLIASGGIRTGLEVVKALALGADLVGIAAPFLRAAARGPQAASDLAREHVAVLRTAMFALGERTLPDLRRTARIRRLNEAL